MNIQSDIVARGKEQRRLNYATPYEWDKETRSYAPVTSVLSLKAGNVAVCSPQHPLCPAFAKWPKTPRPEHILCTITEKIDGTNSLIYKEACGRLWAGSRNRWISPEKDNHGFAAWVDLNSEELLDILPDGYNYGEWAGRRINRGYGMDTRNLYLFNQGIDTSSCAEIFNVPVIQECAFDRLHWGVHSSLNRLHAKGSYLNSFRNPEGIVVTADGFRNIKYIIDK